MTFKEQYKDLEDKFKERIKEDNGHNDMKIPSYYLPNVEPKDKVDFVLVAMEPSGTAKENGQPHVPRNFMASYEDFLTQFCLRKYLCRDEQSCHVTDMAKGGMPTAQAKKTRNWRWPKWYPLLKQELELVAPSARVIALGDTVSKFLKKQEENEKFQHGLAGTIPHFSRQASVARPIAPQLLPKQYDRFSKNVSIADIRGTAEDMMQGREFDESRDSILQGIPKDLSESGRQLLFTYKCLFTVIRGESLADME